MSCIRKSPDAARQISLGLSLTETNAQELHPFGMPFLWLHAKSRIPFGVRLFFSEELGVMEGAQPIYKAPQYHPSFILLTPHLDYFYENQ